MTALSLENVAKAWEARVKICQMVHVSTSQAVDYGGPFYWMRVGCTEKVSPCCKLQELTPIYVTGIVYNSHRILTHIVGQRKEIS